MGQTDAPYREQFATALIRLAEECVEDEVRRELAALATEADPENGFAWMLLAECVDASDENWTAWRRRTLFAIDRAIVAHSSRLQNEPDNRDVLMGRARAFQDKARSLDVPYDSKFRQLPEHSLAIRDVERVLELSPQDQQALSLLGGIYLDSKNYEAAEDAFTQALVAGPKGWAFERRGVTRVLRSKALSPNESLDADTPPDHSPASKLLDLAHQDFNEAIALGENFGYLHRAELLASLGLAPEALEDFAIFFARSGYGWWRAESGVSKLIRRHTDEGNLSSALNIAVTYFARLTDDDLAGIGDFYPFAVASLLRQSVRSYKETRASFPSTAMASFINRLLTQTKGGFRGELVEQIQRRTEALKPDHVEYASDEYEEWQSMLERWLRPLLAEEA